MGNVLCNRVTGAIVGFKRWTKHTFDPATYVEVTAVDSPNTKTQIWDGVDGIRPKTAQELADYDATHPPDTVLHDLIILAADDAATLPEKADAKARLLARRNR